MTLAREAWAGLGNKKRKAKSRSEINRAPAAVAGMERSQACIISRAESLGPAERWPCGEGVVPGTHSPLSLLMSGRGRRGKGVKGEVVGRGARALSPCSLPYEIIMAVEAAGTNHSWSSRCG